MTHEPTVQQLRYFLSAAQHGTLSAAAIAEHIAQPSLSDQVRRLESALGVSLFTRTNRRLQLTEAGRLLRPYAERAVAEMEQLADVVRAARNLEGGLVSVGTFNSAHLYLLTELIRDFHLQHPKVKIGRRTQFIRGCRLRTRGGARGGHRAAASQRSWPVGE